MGTKAKWKKGRLTFYNGAIDDQSVTDTTASSTAITNYGVSCIRTGTTAGTFVIDPPVLGCRKTVIFQTTGILKLRTAAATILSDAATDDVLSCGTSGSTQLGFNVDLFGYTTAVWIMALGSSIITISNTT